ncbi:MAG: hypothetical protein U0271_29500 [Polyangiaceae bacterium]
MPSMGTHFTTGVNLAHHETADEDTGDLILFDRNDPESVRRAQAAIIERFGLPAAPPLCSEPSPGLLGRWRAALRGWFS